MNVAVLVWLAGKGLRPLLPAVDGFEGAERGALGAFKSFCGLVALILAFAMSRLLWGKRLRVPKTYILAKYFHFSHAYVYFFHFPEIYFGITLEVLFILWYFRNLKFNVRNIPELFCS